MLCEIHSFIQFSQFICYFEGRKVNSVPVTQSWPYMEPTFTFKGVFSCYIILG